MAVNNGFLLWSLMCADMSDLEDFTDGEAEVEEQSMDGPLCQVATCDEQVMSAC